MRHRKRGRVLGRSPSHRKAMMTNLPSALFLTERNAEDDDNARSLLVDLLTTMGHTIVAEVSTGREAFERARGSPFRSAC